MVSLFLLLVVVFMHLFTAFKLHIFKIYLYICRLSRIVEDATTFEMELCVCVQASHSTCT